LANLDFIWVNGQISQAHLKVIGNLNSLTRLGLESNAVTDISRLSTLTNLTYLDLRRNQVQDISPLRQLSQINRLNLNGNPVLDFGPILDLPNLYQLELDASARLSADSRNRILNLSSPGDYVTISDRHSLKISGDLTLEALVYAPELGGWGQIIGKGDETAGQDSYFLRLELEDDQVRITFGIWQPGSAEYYLSSVVQAPVFQDWVHLAAVLDTTTEQMSLYLNSQLIVSQAREISAGTDRDMPLNIGAIHGTQFLGTAQLDEIRIWNHARQPEEINANMNHPLKGNENGLAAYWNFDIGLVHDMTNQGSYGQLMGTANIQLAEFPLVIPLMDWSASLSVLSSQPGVDQQHLQFGMIASASSGYDIGQDGLSPPITQSPVMLDAYLSVEDDLVHRLQADWRAISPNAVYQLKIRADEEPFILSWDSSTVPRHFAGLHLKQIYPAQGMSINMRNQSSVIFQPLPEQYYVFELQLSNQLKLQLWPGWNLASLPGSSDFLSPTKLVGNSQTVLLPIYRWHAPGYSYQQVDQLTHGAGYWILSTHPSGEILEFRLNQKDEYTINLRMGWNMIGSVSEVYDFSDPQDSPAQSVVEGSLFEWRAEGFSYQPSDKIEPGKGYWVLALQDCQLTVGGSSPALAPQRRKRPELLIGLTFASDQFQQHLELGLDNRATVGLDQLDRPAPPISPQQSSWVRWWGESHDLMRDIRKSKMGDIGAKDESWHLKLSLEQATLLTLDSQLFPEEMELVLQDGMEETILQPVHGVELRAGERQLTISLRWRLPEQTQLLQNYPNPFNPETWIPFELNQGSDVKLTIYDMAGRLVRRLDIGFQEAGTYLQRDRAIYWDGRTQSGEQVASGTYFYTLKTAGYVSTQKMIILK